MLRRTFIQKMAFAVSTLGLASLPYAVARLLAPGEKTNFSQHLRPPGALENDDVFVEACIGCGLCGEVCPPKCIKFDNRAGGKRVNTPYINPELKACILCNKCMQVCPTEALSIVPRHEIRMGLAQIDRLACYPWVDRGVCGACAGICPLGTKAIDFAFANMYRPYVKVDGCVGCGLCVEICPHPSLPIKIVEVGSATTVAHTI